MTAADHPCHDVAKKSPCTAGAVHTCPRARDPRLADQVRGKLPKLAALLDEAEEDVLAYMSFPKEHRAKAHSTNPLERLDGEIKRRTEVVGHGGSLARLAPQRGRDHPPGRCHPPGAERRMVVQRARYMTLETIAPMRENLSLMLPTAAA